MNEPMNSFWIQTGYFLSRKKTGDLEVLIPNSPTDYLKYRDREMLLLNINDKKIGNLEDLTMDPKIVPKLLELEKCCSS